MSDSIDLTQLKDFIDKLVAEDKFSGVVLIAKEGEVIFKEAWGLASKRFNVPNQIDTKFNLGSMNKMFTAVAISQLAQAGKLSFEDTVEKHLPDYPNKEVVQNVSIHHLLTHTSGLGSYWNDAFKNGARARFRSIQDFIDLFVDDPLEFEPGENFSYSNSGFIVLGAIIEAVSGQSYFDYVLENIHQPAGMLNTDCYEMDEPVPNLAIGYTKVRKLDEANSEKAEYWLNNLYLNVVKGGSAGGGFSTVEDLLSFAKALLENRLLDDDYTKLVTTPKVTLEENLGYGYGFMERRTNGVRIFGHGGGFPGICAGLDIFPDLNFVTVMLSNYDPSREIVDKMRDIIIASTES